MLATMYNHNTLCQIRLNYSFLRTESINGMRFFET